MEFLRFISFLVHQDVGNLVTIIEGNVICDVHHSKWNVNINLSNLKKFIGLIDETY